MGYHAIGLLVLGKKEEIMSMEYSVCFALYPSETTTTKFWRGYLTMKEPVWIWRVFGLHLTKKWAMANGKWGSRFDDIK